MRRFLLFSALLVLVACFPSAASAAPQRYIVVLKDGVSDSAEVARQHSRQHAASVGFVYGHALKGYSATIPSERVAALRADSRVAYVVRDGVASAVAQTLPWGIDRVDADVSSTLAGNGSGAVSNVNAYVIDSGIATHPDLNLTGHVNFAGGKNTDCNGHGTHVAGTIAARDNTSDVVGVAPGAPLTGVKVLGCSGSGSWSGVIKGIDWVTANAQKPAVANMSLGGGVNQAVDDAVRSSAASGVFYAIAAGNEGALACGSSPARAGTTAGVVTTAATDSLEQRGLVEQLRCVRRHLGARRGDPLDEARRRHHDDVRHVHGGPAHRGRRRALPVRPHGGDAGRRGGRTQDVRHGHRDHQQDRPHDPAAVRGRLLAPAG